MTKSLAPIVVVKQGLLVMQFKFLKQESKFSLIKGGRNEYWIYFIFPQSPIFFLGEKKKRRNRTKLGCF